jgi:hypothetical protein
MTHHGDTRPELRPSIGVPAEVIALDDAFVEHGFTISDCNAWSLLRSINNHDHGDCPLGHAPVVNGIGADMPLVNHDLVRCVARNATNYAELPRHTAITAINIAVRVLGVVVIGWPTTHNNEGHK